VDVRVSVCENTRWKATRALLMEAERLSPLKNVSITFNHVRSCATQLSVSSDISGGGGGGGIAVCCCERHGFLPKSEVSSILKASQTCFPCSLSRQRARARQTARASAGAHLAPQRV
jgi:hypothetical protein